MKKHYSLLNFFLYLITITIICAIIFIYYFSKQLGPGLIECAEDEVTHLTILIMNNCIKKYTSENNNLELLKIERNSQGIERIQYDTKILNKTKADIIDLLETDLEFMIKGDLESIGLNPNKLSDEYYEKTNDGVLFTVSIGSITGNPLFANIGPKIPLNLKPIGNVTAEVTTNITEYGLNNALIEVSIELETTTIIQMPFLSKKITVKNKIPLTMEIIQGIIPGYYLNYGVQ